MDTLYTPESYILTNTDTAFPNPKKAPRGIKGKSGFCPRLLVSALHGLISFFLVRLALRPNTSATVGREGTICKDRKTETGEFCKRRGISVSGWLYDSFDTSNPNPPLFHFSPPISLHPFHLSPFLVSVRQLNIQNHLSIHPRNHIPRKGKPLPRWGNVRFHHFLGFFRGWYFGGIAVWKKGGEERIVGKIEAK